VTLRSTGSSKIACLSHTAILNSVRSRWFRAPATKNSNTIKDFKAGRNAWPSAFQILVNTWSTFIEAPIGGADDRRRDPHSTNS
jgi:hypothetical protein